MSHSHHHRPAAPHPLPNRPRRFTDVGPGELFLWGKDAYRRIGRDEDAVNAEQVSGRAAGQRVGMGSQVVLDN